MAQGAAGLDTFGLGIFWPTHVRMHDDERTPLLVNNDLVVVYIVRLLNHFLSKRAEIKIPVDRISSFDWNSPDTVDSQPMQLVG